MSQLNFVLNFFTGVIELNDTDVNFMFTAVCHLEFIIDNNILCWSAF